MEILLSQGADASIKVQFTLSPCHQLIYLMHAQDSDEFTAPELARIAGHDVVGIILEKAINKNR